LLSFFSEESSKLTANFLLRSVGSNSMFYSTNSFDCARLACSNNSNSIPKTILLSSSYLEIFDPQLSSRIESVCSFLEKGHTSKAFLSTGGG